ncbi:Nuclease-related domain-containing protein [Fibrobacter sp. UWB16]|uniref:nuclease-related domain-containing protein n=1 Tax=Fibrobacter sp. UWB16 TaxID=1945874 RepID=UPI000BC90AF7|nr:nuclease-related domain-containing protein [Fibrobacter sp. UWB16]SOD17880.1 Nuclease-related domain-containing protein [Fibrobacter sp. UWB16]
MLLFIIAIIIITLITLFNFMCAKPNDSAAYVPPKLSGNQPFPIQRKIKENQEEYDKKILASPFNVNDWLSIHPGNDKLGPYGEFLTTKKAVNACKETTTYFKILNNLYINTDKGSTEIDVLMIHETGIYVFESKNFSGQIYGEYKQKKWLQYLGNERNHFYNPIWQNEGHIDALKSVLGNELPYISIIVFSERCELKEIPDNKTDMIILNRYSLESKLVHEFNQRNKDITIEQVDEIYDRMKNFANGDIYKNSELDPFS